MDIEETPVSANTTTLPTSAPHVPNEPSVPQVSQTQVEVEDVDSDDEDEHPASQDDRTFAQFNNPFDCADEIINDMSNHISRDDDEYNELRSIVDHHFVDGVSELQIEYDSGETEWHPLFLVKDEDPKATAAFILQSDFGTIINGKHRRWARKFLRSLKRTMRRLFRVRYTGYRAMVYDPLPKVPTVRTRHAIAAIAARAKAKPKKKKSGNSQMGSFKYGIEVPKKWCDFLRIDADMKNTKWQDAVQKEAAALLLHQCFDFGSSDFKPSSDYQYAPLNLYTISKLIFVTRPGWYAMDVELTLEVFLLLLLL